MKALYEKSFLKDIKKVRNQKILDALDRTITDIKAAESLNLIPKIKKLRGHHSAYRIRFGEYRLGFFLENETIIFSRFLNRKDVYNRFA
jgi:mRNA interferase RelE/StbE